MGDQLSGQPDTATLPETIETAVFGRVRLVVPGRTYPAGSCLAVIWPSIQPPVSAAVLRDRARTMGTPWQLKNVPAIGVQLSEPQTGIAVVSRLTGQTFKAGEPGDPVIPFEVPQAFIQPGLLVGAGSGAYDQFLGGEGATSLLSALTSGVDDIGDSAGDLLSSFALATRVTLGIAAALPWIALAGGIGYVGYLVYAKATRKRGKK